MRARTSQLMCLILVVITANAAKAEEDTAMTSLEFVTHYESALATQQWEAVSPLIHERASVVFSNGSVHRGKEAVRKAYERNFDAIKNEHYVIANLHWLLDSPETAVYMFDFSWSGVIDGKEASGGGRGTAVLTHEDGRWQLLAEHLGYPEH
ncbi:MAG: DUF4440 domain-containing protein [Pseudomonadota bacterium]